ncbi:MAG: phosphoribosylanthranilate isomerase [Methanobacteriaceae archaeon]|nr:phosphoribosylanthranilate isomerase [Methanobacteriaceae archaeon]
MKIKICGIRNKDDLKTCEGAGADLMGFINIERSKRMVEIEKIRNLTSSMKDKNKAVLVIEPSNMVDADERIKKSGLNNIQLHSLYPDEIKEMKNTNPHLTVTRAIGISEEIKPKKEQEIKDFVCVSDNILFDYEFQGKTGGTGRQIPTETALEAAEIARSYNKNVTLFLAGGMNVERIKNEGKKLATIFNYFDVNSGVEDAPGVKNRDKIRELMKLKFIN